MTTLRSDVADLRSMQTIQKTIDFTSLFEASEIEGYLDTYDIAPTTTSNAHINDITSDESTAENEGDQLKEKEVIVYDVSLIYRI